VAKYDDRTDSLSSRPHRKKPGRRGRKRRC
jgi:hypothetical protein